MQGNKTHEQQLRMFEHKRDLDAKPASSERAPDPDKDKRQSEFAVSERGAHQESSHNKHNDAGQEGHKPQKHTEAG